MLFPYYTVLYDRVVFLKINLPGTTTRNTHIEFSKTYAPIYIIISIFIYPIKCIIYTHKQNKHCIKILH